MLYGHMVDVLVLVVLPAVLLLLSVSREAESLGVARDSAPLVSSDSAAAMVAAAVSGLFADSAAAAGGAAPISASVAAAADFVSHAFVQTGSELHYFRDVSHQDVLLSSISELANRQGRKTDLKKAPKGVSIFESEATLFGALSVGVPVSRRVFVVNPTNARLSFTAITSPAVGVHCSFFADKTLEPHERTNFTIYLLPSRAVPIDDTILVHTSIGKFSHKVLGYTAVNPYRLQPLFGVKLPLNATHVSALTLHNPHAASMTVTEVFSSDANVQVELSESALMRSGAATKWELAPFETREIVKLHVHGNMERNSTSFVYIRFRVRHSTLIDPSYVDNGDDGEKALVLPVEVQVTNRRNIFSTEHRFDFGMIRYGERSSQRTFHVFSNIEKGVNIESIYAPQFAAGEGARRQDVYVQFAAQPPLSIKSGPRGQPGTPVAIAKLTLSSVIGNSDIRINDKLYRKQGMIIAESRGGNFNVTVLYEALIYKGDLLYDERQLAFYCQESLPAVQNIVLTNNFSVTLAIWNVSISNGGRNVFKAELSSPIVVLGPGQALPALIVRYVHAQSNNVSAELILHTNLTEFRLPLYTFRGRLNVRQHAPSPNYARALDFGELAAGERRSVLLRVENPNPVAVRVDVAQRPWPTFTRVLVLHSHEDDGDTKLQEVDFFELPANGELTLSVSLFAAPQNALFDTRNPLFSDVEHEARLVLSTHFEELIFRATFRTSTASIVVGSDTIEFDDGFVGTVTSKPVKVYSTYPEDLSVNRIYLLGDDPRLSIAQKPNTSVIIKSEAVSTLAHVTFAPETSCALNPNGNECYTGIPLESADGQWFTYGLRLPQNLVEIDSYLYGRLRRRWTALVSKTVNATVIIDTPRVKNFAIPVSAHLKWPRLFSHSVVRFPLTAVGNFSIVNLTLSNPSQRPIVVQLLPLVIYPDAESVLDYFRGEFPAPLIEPVEMSETLMFSLRDTELFTLRNGSPVPKLREELEAVAGTPIPRFTLSMLLRPGMRVRIRIGFLPSDYVMRSSLLLIRNNLTGIEPVVLYGQGAQIRLEIENRMAREGSPLLFAIQPAHLTDCRNPHRLLHKLASTLTVKRSFTVRNTGEVPFSVVNISINNQPCENRGFRVLNCAPFRLAPNQSTVLEIAYTPDFLMTQNDALLQLYMLMNGTPWVFDMCAQIPRHMLATCHTALPRPAFEGIMYYSCVFALSFCLICVLACSYLEGDRTVSCAIRQLFLGRNERRIFDLNSVTATAFSAVAVDGDSEIAEKDTPPQKSWLGWMRSRRQLTKPPRNRVYLLASSDSSWPSCFCRRVANYILWFFSHFWLFLRGDDGGGGGNGVASVVYGVNDRQSDRVGITRSPRVRSRRHGQRQNHENQVEADHEILQSVNQTKAEDSASNQIKELPEVIQPIRKKASDSKDEIVESQQSELRQRKKKKEVDHLLPSSNISTTSVTHSSSSSSNDLQTSTMTKQKKRAKKSSNSGQKIRSRFAQVAEEPIERINEFDDFETRQLNTPRAGKSVEETLTIDPIGPPPEHTQPTPSPGRSSSAASSSSRSFVKLDADELNQASPLLAGGFNSSGSVYGHGREFTGESRGTSIYGNDEERRRESGCGLSDAAPEWADSTPSHNKNVDDEFCALALNTAALCFEDMPSAPERAAGTDSEFSPSPPLSSSSHSSSRADAPSKHFQRTPRRPNGHRKPTVDESQRRPKKPTVENLEIERYIGRMTRDYRERLKRAIASGMPIEDVVFANPPKLRFPDDLLANCAESRRDGPSSSMWPASSLSGFDASTQLPLLELPGLSVIGSAASNVGVIGDGGVISRSVVTSRPLTELEPPSMLPFVSDSSIWGWGAATQPSPKATSDRATEHFLFAGSDPIWKPIFEEQSSNGFWSTDFNFGSLNVNSNNNSCDDQNDNSSNNIEKKAKNE